MNICGQTIYKRLKQIENEFYLQEKRIFYVNYDKPNEINVSRTERKTLPDCIYQYLQKKTGRYTPTEEGQCLRLPSVRE